MDLGLKNKVALITGASSGLGLAIANELSQEGASVVMVARRKDELDKHAAAIGGRTYGKLLTIAAAGVRRYGAGVTVMLCQLPATRALPSTQ